MNTHRMPDDQFDWLCNEILSLIEINETRLLNWGFVDVRSNLVDDIPSLLSKLPDQAKSIWDQAVQEGYSKEDILKNLVERKLVFQIDGYYRSRFAEAIRLFYHLKQRFSPSDWQTASRLVSDIRIQLQRRRYPKRNIVADELIQELSKNGADKDYIECIVRLLKGQDGKSLMLSGFQKNAIIEQFSDLRNDFDHGIVIGAGTGAGKTKAFYIPAMAEVAAAISDKPNLKILAIYPRVELLKDQLVESFQEARKLDSWLKQKNKNAISIGAYYGDTPYSANYLLSSEKSSINSFWDATDDKTGWICPYFYCPNTTCNNREMVWLREDVVKEVAANQREEYGKHARLQCPSCHFEVTAAQLLLTREQMVHTPPDILLTSTEMLNRRISRTEEHDLFGIGSNNPPRLVLLDEIHTYEGLHGAQVAYLLRRWQYARRSKRGTRGLCIVGLSATLRDAENFFSNLTGIPQYKVVYIAPSEDDLIEESMEYNLVLKGDPVSGTSLLSTSVQSVMLLGRILDRLTTRRSETISHGAIGQKIFAFTDKLDVINRWYHIETDAERNKTLSQYRAENEKQTSDQQEKIFLAGQTWKVCNMIGHNLKTPLRLGLTSSQYRGVRSDADVIIATSTLEVGFNDTTVGAVIQHKAPRSMASFLQRKGRAGRTRTMRPWMLVVASSYGRDRWAFQHAENLFNPLLPPLDLPIKNYYVQKIQATYVLLDWIAFELKKQGISVDAWEMCTNKGTSSYSESYAQNTSTLLRKILEGSLLNNFIEFMKGALSLQDDDATVTAILWGEPRPLLLEVIPSLMRQLANNWQIIENGIVKSHADSKSRNPLPRYLPASLFSELNLPELIIHLPSNVKPASSIAKGTKNKTIEVKTAQDEARDENMELSQALQEFAPGNVSKRFSRKENIKESHWLSLPDDAQLSRGMLPLQYLKVKFDEIPELLETSDGQIPVYRPLEYTLDFVPKNVKDTSYSRLIWKSDFRIQGNTLRQDTASEENEQELGLHIDLSHHSQWYRFIKEIMSYSQENGSWVKVNRFANGIEADTRFEGGNNIRRKLFFEQNGEAAAIGYSIDADALQFKLAPISLELLIGHFDWPTLRQSLVPSFFLYCLKTDLRVIEIGLSTFEIEWLWQLELSMLTATAISKNITLQEASYEVNQNRLLIAERTMRVIFQSQKQEDTDQDDLEGRLFRKLMEYLSLTTIVDSICDSEKVLWSEPDASFFKCLESCYRSSLGSSIFTAITRMIPDIQSDDLMMDIDEDSIWITETTAGGIGLVSRIASALSLHPRDFELQLQDTLTYCEREQLAIQLSIISQKIREDNPNLAILLKEIRQKVDLPKIDTTSKMLSQVLKSFGIPVRRDLMVAINTKFLRPNSDRDSDILISDLVNEWKYQESRLGIKIDLRVMAVAAWRVPSLQQQIKLLMSRIAGEKNEVEENQVFNLLQSMLWLNCIDSCPECIEYWNPFQDLPHPSRSLLFSLYIPDQFIIEYQAEHWEEKLKEQLINKYQGLLYCRQDQLAACKQDVVEIIIEPVEIGFQNFYPVIERISNKDIGWEISLVIKELLGG